jgi:hypothetical protein
LAKSGKSISTVIRNEKMVFFASGFIFIKNQSKAPILYSNTNPIVTIIKNQTTIEKLMRFKPILKAAGTKHDISKSKIKNNIPTI